MSVSPGSGARAFVAVGLFLGLVFASAGAWASPRQDMGECDVPQFDSMRWNTVTTIAGENRILHFKKPTIRCPGGTTIKSDSVRVYEATQYYQLYGNVEFVDSDSRLTSDQAQYFSEQRRLSTTGNSVLTNLVDGSVVTGHAMTLIRGETEADGDFLTVQGGQPHATLYPAVQPVEEADPVEEGGEGEGVEGGEETAEEPGDQDPRGPEMPPDSLMSDPDPGDAAQDSAGVVLDTLAAEMPDSMAPGDTAVVLDTLAVPPDSTAVLPDSTQGEPGAAAAEPDPPEEPVERIPYEIDARRFVLEGSDYFRAVGNVVVTRDSLTATADSLEYDQTEGALFLSEDASVVTADYDLSADDIRLAIPQDEIREARASGDAILDGQDLQLVSPIVTLFFTDGILDRLVAVRDPVLDSIRAEMDDEAREQERLLRGAPPLSVRELGFSEFPDRPYALAQDFALDGDSLEVLAPGEIIDQVWAIGNARGESMGEDSLSTEETPELISRDWLEGDTIIAFFIERADSLSDLEPERADLTEDPEAPPLELERAEDDIVADSTGVQYQLEQLVARGNARSMYRMAPSDSTAAEEPGRFAVHYVVGDEITILLNEAGEAEKMEVAGQTRGIHLEPVSNRQNVIDSTAVPHNAPPLGATGRGIRFDTMTFVPDTTGANPDTTVVDPDTTRVDPDTTAAGFGTVATDFSTLRFEGPGSGSVSRVDPIWLRRGRGEAAGSWGRGGSKE